MKRRPPGRPKASSTKARRTASSLPRQASAGSAAGLPLLTSRPPLSPFDRWIRILEASPRARWSFYLALPAASIALLLGLSWACGSLPAGQISPQLTVTAVLSIATVGEIHYVMRVAGRCLIRFAPALRAGPAEFDGYHHAFTTAPAWAVVAAAVGGVAMLALVTTSDPTFFGLLSAGLCPRPAVLLVGWINSAAFVLATLLALRYLSLIRRAHAAAPEVNLFERGPLFAFSALSSRMALLFALASYIFVLAFPSSLENVAAAAYIFGINLPATLVIFVYPLYGMHGRMIEEKQRLLQASGTRIHAALETLHSDSGGRRSSNPDPHRRLTALMEEEAYLRKIPTWPWEPGTLTAVLTAVFLPLMLVVAQQVVSRYFAG